MSAVVSYLRREPARVIGLVLAVLGLLAAFGLGLSEEQAGAVVAVVAAVLALAGAEVTRSQVTPVDPGE